MPKLDGSVESIVFRNEENHYTVARFRPNDSGRLFRDDLTTIVGALPGVHVGELLTVEGEWEKDPKYGRQLHVTSFVQRLPASPEGIMRYLSSGLIKGIGPKKAERIVAHFGEQTLAIIEQQPERLSEVKGISTKDREQIIQSWVEQNEVKELHLFLQSHDVSINLATRIYKQYGQESIKIIRENPYKLADDVSGIGFRTAYEILQAPFELLREAVEQLKSERDVFIESPLPPAQPPASSPSANGDTPPVDWSEAVESGQRIYFGPFWHAENGSARILRTLLRSQSKLPPVSQHHWDAVFNYLAEKRNMLLTEKQRA